MIMMALEATEAMEATEREPCEYDALTYACKAVK